MQYDASFLQTSLVQIRWSILIFGPQVHTLLFFIVADKMASRFYMVASFATTVLLHYCLFIVNTVIMVCFRANLLRTSTQCIYWNNSMDGKHF
jgi:hypothetical protein